MDVQERPGGAPRALQDAPLITLACTLCLAATFGTWEPDVAAARAYAASRPAATITFAVRTQGRFFGHDTRRQVPAASTMKALLLVAYLRRARHRPLTAQDRALLDPMVRRSDNAAATRVRDIVGYGALQRLGGEGFSPAGAIWGHTAVTARGLTRFMLRVDRLTPPRHRAYAMRLLRTIVPSQRWGIARVAPRGWRLHFKGGWGSGSGAVTHQIALLVRGRQRVSLAVMTVGNPSHRAGEKTLRGVAARLLRGLARVTG